MTQNRNEKSEHIRFDTTSVSKSDKFQEHFMHSICPHFLSKMTLENAQIVSYQKNLHVFFCQKVSFRFNHLTTLGVLEVFWKFSACFTCQRILWIGSIAEGFASKAMGSFFFPAPWWILLYCFFYLWGAPLVATSFQSKQAAIPYYHIWPCPCL